MDKRSLSYIADALNHIALTLEYYLLRDGDPSPTGFSRRMTILALDASRKYILRNIAERRRDQS